MFLTRRLVNVYRATTQVKSGFFLTQNENYKAIENKNFNPDTKEKF
jgi:hypothetical protein